MNNVLYENNLPNNHNLFKDITIPIFVTTCAYFLMGVMGQLISIPPGFATIIWPAAGVALGATLFWGNKVLPGVFLGSFFINIYIAFTSSFLSLNPTLPLIIAIGATLQAYVGALVTKRVVGFPFKYHQPIVIVKFLITAGVLCSLINASISCIAMWQFQVIDTGSILVNWLNWWAGDSLGVIIMVPWLLVLFPNRAHAPLPRQKLFQFSLFSITALTMALSFLMTHFEKERQKEEFTNNANLLAQSISDKIQSSIDVLYGISGLIQSKENLSPSSFKHYTAPILARSPELHGLSWNIVVKHADIPDFNRTMNQLYQNNSVDFSAKERTNEGELIPVQAREKHVVVSFIEPFASNKNALGYDVYSQQTRRSALDEASSLKHEVVTRPIRLIQEKSSQAGVLIFLPVFSNDNNKLLGFATAVLRVGDIAQAAFSMHTLPNTSITLYDPQSRKHQLLYRSGQVNLSDNALLDKIRHSDFALVATRQIKIGNHHWQFVQSSPSPYIYDPWATYFLLISGLFVAGVLNWLLIVLAGHTYEIKQQVKVRTTALSKSNVLLETSQDIANMGSWEWHPNSDSNVWSNGLYLLLGYTHKQEASLEAFLMKVHPSDKDRVLTALVEWQQGSDKGCHIECLTTQPKKQIIALSCKRLDNDENLYIVIKDVTKTKESEEKIHKLAYFDSLTGLPNRAHFIQQLEQNLRIASRKKVLFSVFFLDVDHFKAINDTFGHDVGDELLCNIAERIKNSLRECDFSSRFGGDEFCIMVNEIPDRESAKIVATKLLATINNPMILNELNYTAKSSIGIAMFPEDGTTSQQLIKAADDAMYQAKHLGGNQFSFTNK
jgi:diguanylate cyclase (GGDEF)-like protein